MRRTTQPFMVSMIGALLYKTQSTTEALSLYALNGVTNKGDACHGDAINGVGISKELIVKALFMSRLDSLLR